MRSDKEVEQLISIVEPGNYDRLPVDVLTDNRFIDQLGLAEVRAIDENPNLTATIRQKINERLYQRMETDNDLKRALERWRYVTYPNPKDPASMCNYLALEARYRAEDEADKQQKP